MKPAKKALLASGRPRGRAMNRDRCPLGAQGGRQHDERFSRLREMATPRGFEPPTYRLGICRSILLSYGVPPTVPHSGATKTSERLLFMRLRPPSSRQQRCDLALRGLSARSNQYTWWKTGFTIRG